MEIKVLYGHLKAIFELIRIKNAIISFFGAYVGALVFSLGAPIDTLLVLAAAISAAFILGGGNALNDYFDIEIDKINRPKRPIPSGRISKSDAFMLSLTMFLVGLGVAKSINDYCLIIAFVNTVLLMIYARYSKKMLLISNLSISYLVASVFVYGAAAVYSPKVWINPDGVMLTAVLTVCAFLINFSREIIKDIEDIDGDKKTYSATVPIRYGRDHAKQLAFITAFIAALISFTPILLPSIGFNELLYGLFIILTNLIVVASFTTTPTINQRLLVVGMTLALAAFLLGVSVPQVINQSV